MALRDSARLKATATASKRKGANSGPKILGKDKVLKYFSKNFIHSSLKKKSFLFFKKVKTMAEITQLHRKDNPETTIETYENDPQIQKISEGLEQIKKSPKDPIIDRSINQLAAIIHQHQITENVTRNNPDIRELWNIIQTFEEEMRLARQIRS